MRLTLAALICGLLAVTGIPAEDAPASAPVSFNHEILPLLTKAGCNSGACHGALAGKGGLKLSLRGYDPEADHFVLTRQALGRRIDGSAPERSLLLLKPSGGMKHGGGRRVEADSNDYALLKRWIGEAAPGLKANEPALVGLEVRPKEQRLAPEETLRPTVLALYADGKKRDVTHWARFSSTNENVAIVDADGKVTLKGPGEAAIAINFGTQVALVNLAAPFANPAPDRASFQTHNLIDERVNEKLEALNLPPSPTCTDEEFLRRVNLDVTGTLPSLDAQQRFLSDTRSDKRARLIDQLLASPEYVDYWAHKWGDLFLVSSLKLPQAAVWAFHQHLRNAVARNLPWDQFARDLLTAQGSNLENGAVNYFLLHKDPAGLAEKTSITFLGMSLACAKCHNHPLEKWTQDEYWSYANLFSQVSLQNGDRGGEVVAKDVPAGDVLHLRRGTAMLPRPPDGQPCPTGQDRRAYFASWLTSPENPYFAKAIINRVWRHYLGRGLVEAEDDLRVTNPPSNAPLLAALEKQFIADGYDLKKLMRLILNSAAYQRSAKTVPGNEADDRYYSHGLPRRLSAEVLLDAYSQVTGVPTAFTEVHSGGTGGAMKIADYPAGTRAVQLADTKVLSRFLDTFGRPPREVACSCEREQDSSVRQALHLANGESLNTKLRDPKSRVETWLKEKTPDEAAVRELFRLALCRLPTPAEEARLLKLLAAAAQDGQPRREQLEDLCWAVLTSQEFLFNR